MYNHMLTLTIPKKYIYKAHTNIHFNIQRQAANTYEFKHLSVTHYLDHLLLP